MSRDARVAQCDRCGLVKGVPGGAKLPKGWECDWTTGEDHCAECVHQLALRVRREA